MHFGSHEIKPIFVDADSIAVPSVIEELGISPHSVKEINATISEEKRGRKHILVVKVKEEQYECIYGFGELEYRKDDGESKIGVYILGDLSTFEKRAFRTLDLNPNIHTKGLAVKTLLVSKGLCNSFGEVTEQALSKLMGSPGPKTVSAWKRVSDMSVQEAKQLSCIKDTRSLQEIAPLPQESLTRAIRILAQQRITPSRQTVLSLCRNLKSNPNVTDVELQKLMVSGGNELEFLDADIANTLKLLSEKKNKDPCELLKEMILDSAEPYGIGFELNKNSLDDRRD